MYIRALAVVVIVLLLGGLLVYFAAAAPVAPTSAPTAGTTPVVAQAEVTAEEFTPDQRRQARHDIQLAFDQYVPARSVTECYGYDEGEWSPDPDCKDYQKLAAFIALLEQDARLLDEIPGASYELEVKMNVIGSADAPPVAAGSDLEARIDAAYDNAVLSPGMTAETSNQKLACLRGISMRDFVQQLLHQRLSSPKVRLDKPTGRCDVIDAIGPDFRGVTVEIIATMRQVPAELAPNLRQSARNTGFVRVKEVEVSQ